MYLLLALAIVSEVTATVARKLSEGFTRWLPSIFVVVGYAAAFEFLASVLKAGMPIGVAYAVWAAVGVALVALIGALFLGESMTWLQVGGLLLVIAGVVALELGSAH
ncbi:multidrug transporter [Longimycelium tulufanense]|uniref:Multidrug transporter n=2 Tax=Longimycelium tulufanense TaxID=907463 RepID=A0A8J3FVU4_9PSEU|nr:multidrug transporter [Longimycelium tulufanense]